MRMHLYFKDKKFVESILKTIVISNVSLLLILLALCFLMIFTFMENINNTKINQKLNIPLGFHPHNNLNLAFANTLAALKTM